MWTFDRIQRRNYFGGESTGRAGVEARVGKLKNGKDTGKERVVDWI